MGSRGNIQVIQSGGEVWFYTHWRGYDLKRIVANALKRGMDRWDDETYFARIVFCELIGDATELAETTGFGIGTREGDSNHPTVTIDCVNRGITVQNKVCSFGEFMQRYANAAVDDNKGE